MAKYGINLMRMVTLNKGYLKASSAQLIIQIPEIIPSRSDVVDVVTSYSVFGQTETLDATNFYQTFARKYQAVNTAGTSADTADTATGKNNS